MTVALLVLWLARCRSIVLPTTVLLTGAFVALVVYEPPLLALGFSGGGDA